MKRTPFTDSFSNTTEPAATQARITIIVLDTLNTAFFDQVTARREILKFLSNVEPGEPVAVVNLNKSGLHVIHDFTTDPKVLAAAVRQVEGQIGFKDNAGADHASENLPPAIGRSTRLSDDMVPEDQRVSQEARGLSHLETETEGVFASIEQSFSIRVTLESMRQ